MIVKQPDHTRPWQHVLDCCVGYLVAGWMDVFPGAINVGPKECMTVREVVDLMSIYMPVMVTYEKRVYDPLDTPRLALNTSLAKSVGIRPLLPTVAAARMTAEWYAAEQKKEDTTKLSLQQIDSYHKLGADAQLPWAVSSTWLSDLTP